MISIKNIVISIVIILLNLSILNGQCFPDRHTTNWFDGWISCEKAPNPILDYDDSHWILYDFKSHYKLGKMRVWNSNDPSHLDYGMKMVQIDYSTDGIEWNNLGEYELEMANGINSYEGIDGPDFEGSIARYVLLTAISNYGGACYGLSEIRIEAEKTTVPVEEINMESQYLAARVYPNPIQSDAKLEISTRGSGEVIVSIIDVLGNMMHEERYFPTSIIHTIGIDGYFLSEGTYFVLIRQGSQSRQLKVISITK